MGYYIEAPKNKGKADWLIANYGAKEVTAPITYNHELINICVVDNGPFEAAAIGFSEREIEAFLPNEHDQRPRRWLLLPRATVIKLCPHVEYALD